MPKKDSLRDGLRKAGTRHIVIILFFSLLLVGCATLQQMTNLDRATQYRQNLVGMTQQQILDMFGRPDNVDTSYSNFGTMEFWTYYHTSTIFPYNRTTINITFTNGVVTNVNYW